MPLFSELLEQSPKMHIRTNMEVLNGVWDSLVINRADIVIGADMDIPETIGAVSTLDLGNLNYNY